MCGEEGVIRSPRSRRLLGKLLLVGASAGCSLVLIEIMLRLILPGPPFKVYNVDLRGVHQISHIPGLVYELKPDAQRELKIGDHAGTYRINSAGMRDYSYPFSKVDTVFRIVCLGDSVTFGAGVELDEAYHKVLEKLLNANRDSSIRYEVMNFGVSGYNTAQEVIVLREKALLYKPDIVLVGFTLNDGSPIPALEEVLEDQGGHDPGRISLPGKAWLQDNSYLYGVVALRGEQLLLRLGIWKRKRIYGLTAELFENMTEKKQETEAWKRVEVNLRQIVKASNQTDATVILLVFPLQVQMNYDSRRQLLRNLTLEDLRRPQKRLRRFAGENGIVYIDLLPSLDSNRTSDRPLFVNDVTSHPDALGHRIVAEEILRVLEERRLIPASRR